MIKKVYDIEKIRDPEEIWEKLNLKVSYNENGLKSLFLELYSVIMVRKDKGGKEVNKTNTNYDELYECIGDNDWIEYFLQCDMHGDENWIDFESEISEVVKSIEDDMGDRGIYEDVLALTNEFFNNKYTNNTTEYYSAVSVSEAEKIRKRVISYKKLRDILIDDLDRLIRALEIYLVEDVGKIVCNITAPDIQSVCFDAILSFNYTNTYMRLYDSNKLSDYDYIHGEADLSHTIVTNNMVLGIDEYLSKKNRNIKTEFISFKKYYQRIHKSTGCRYKEWLEDINSEKPIRNREFAGIDENGCKVIRSVNATHHNLYIFGHSLDITDKDVLKELIINPKVKTIVYYNKRYDADGYDDNGRKSLGEKIANLAKVIGQEALIRRTGGSSKTIEFKLQQDMIKD